MKKKNLLIIIIFIIFCFIILLKGLNNPNTYIPKKISANQLISFDSKKLFNNQKISFEELLVEDKIYLLNIWASWCLPCRDEHEFLMELSQNPSITIIGLNYKDNLVKAKKFVNQFGNPYSEILVDINGTISIELGAYGVPETIVFDKNRNIMKKFFGPLNNQSLEEIKYLLK